MKILGLDPGLTATGYGLIFDHKKVLFGTIRPREKDYLKKIYFICQHIKSIIRKYKPEIVSLEKAFFQKNVVSLIKISELRGAIIYILLQDGIPLVEYTPAQIKLATTGNGRASKRQVRFIMEKTIIKNKTRISHHAIDALAIAYTALRKFK
ncbi:MAG: crossover junction endodeoxyribonuclease RuvC [candidate division WOR-3 bacterium]|nr:crossover junction endodeoxyribonuclease RuvC [candidate division WOR-3 bacterium]